MKLIKKFRLYVENTEKITLLLHGISRRMKRMEAEAELKALGLNRNEWMDRTSEKNKLERLAEQLEDAKEINLFVSKKLPCILFSLERHVNPRAKDIFVSLMALKIKYLLQVKEIQHKLQMEESLKML